MIHHLFAFCLKACHVVEVIYNEVTLKRELLNSVSPKGQVFVESRAHKMISNNWGNLIIKEIRGRPIHRTETDPSGRDQRPTMLSERWQKRFVKRFQVWWRFTAPPVTFGVVENRLGSKPVTDCPFVYTCAPFWYLWITNLCLKKTWFIKNGQNENGSDEKDVGSIPTGNDVDL